MDRMEIYEISAILKYGYMKHKDLWEVGRYLVYVIAQSNSTKSLTPEGLMPLAWDKNKRKEITKEEIDRIAELAKYMEKNLKFDK